MALTITHSTPADGTFSATGAAAWDATHSLTVTGTSGEIQYNNAGNLAGMSGTAWNDTTRSLTLTGATVTASAPVLDLSQTWNNAAVTFTGLKFNATDTASASGSLLMQLQMGGVDKAQITKSGNILLNPTGNTGIVSLTGSGTALRALEYFENGFGVRNGGSEWVVGFGVVTNAGGSGVYVRSGDRVAFSSSATDVYGSVADLILTRRAAANLRFGAADAAAPVAQTLSVQSVVAGTTNTAGANFTITGSQGTGTGAGGSIIFQVAPAGSSGTAQNALVDALTINSSRQVVFADGSQTAPSIRGGNSNSGIFFAGNNIRITSDGANRASFDALCNLNISSLSAIRWTSSSDPNGVPDTLLSRDAANTLALRNGTNAQTARIYGSFTSASVYKRLALSSTTTVATVAAETDSGDMDLALTPAGAGNVRYGTHSAIGAETVTGFITIKDSGGTVRKLAVVS